VQAGDVRPQVAAYEDRARALSQRSAQPLLSLNLELTKSHRVRSDVEHVVARERARQVGR
jgi:hypothetical protein